VREAVVLAREDVPGEKRLGGLLYGSAWAEVKGRVAAPAFGRHCCRSTWCHRGTWRWRRSRSQPTGKLDRKALPAPDLEAYVRQAYERPLESSSAVLPRFGVRCSSWIGSAVTDNFFELGGHSLLVIAGDLKDTRWPGRRDEFK